MATETTEAARTSLECPLVLSAVRLVGSDFATAGEHRPGPWPSRLSQEFKEPLYAAPPLLDRLADAGLPDRKTGRGFSTS